MPKRLDITDERYGRLVGLNFIGCDKSKNTLWEFQCDCGNVTIKRLSDVRFGKIKSCGCLHQDNTVERNTKHNKSKTRTYSIWKGMKRRCLSPSRPRFKDYGRRGITVCDRWRNSYDNFLTDMGEAPINYTLERIDNEKGYSPDNCKWASYLEQSHNQRMRTTNTSGYRGVYYCKTVKRWKAQINHAGKRLFSKSFKTITQAVVARNEFIIDNNLPHRLNQLPEHRD